MHTYSDLGIRMVEREHDLLTRRYVGCKGYGVGDLLVVYSVLVLVRLIQDRYTAMMTSDRVGYGGADTDLHLFTHTLLFFVHSQTHIC